MSDLAFQSFKELSSYPSKFWHENYTLNRVLKKLKPISKRCLGWLTHRAQRRTAKALDSFPPAIYGGLEFHELGETRMERAQTLSLTNCDHGQINLSLFRHPTRVITPVSANWLGGLNEK